MAEKDKDGFPRLSSRKSSKVGRGFTRFVVNYWISIATLLGIILLWEIYVRIMDVPVYILPAPSVIANAILEKWNLLLKHSGWTLYEVILGFAIGVIVALPMAVTIVYSKFAEKTLYTYLVALQAVPKIALAPLLIAWFGFSQTPKIIVAALICFFPIVVDTVVGLKSMPVEMFHLARSMGASEWETFWKFRLPHGLPSIFGGLKVAISLAVIGAVVGEYVAGNNGLGYLQTIVSGNMNTPMVFATLVFLSVIGIGLFYLMVLIEGWAIRWDPSKLIDKAKVR